MRTGSKDLSNKEYKINEYLSVKLKGKKTVIYVADEPFEQCSTLMIEKFDKIESVYEIAEILKWDNRFGQKGVDLCEKLVKFCRLVSKEYFR